MKRVRRYTTDSDNEQAPSETDDDLIRFMKRIACDDHRQHQSKPYRANKDCEAISKLLERVSNILDHNEPAQSDKRFIKPKVARDKANRLQQLQRQRLQQLRRQRLQQAKWGREDKVRKEALSIEVSNGAVGNR